VKIWTGANASNLVLQQPLQNPFPGNWNYVTLSSPVPIDISQELWIGYHTTTFTGNPAGFDDGPAIDGYGNMINLNGNWMTLLQYNPQQDANWNLQGYVQSAERELTDITFYLFKDNVQIGTYNQFNPMPNPYCTSEEGEYCFYLNAAWESETDYCESGLELMGCEQVVFNSLKEAESTRISIYPNPAKDVITIHSSLPLDWVSVFNLSSIELISVSPGSTAASLDLSGLKEGIYLLLLQTEKSVSFHKIILLG